MTYQDMLDKLAQMRTQYAAGDITGVEVVEYASDFAFESGTRGEYEEIVTALVFTNITGEEYNSDDWA